MKNKDYAQLIKTYNVELKYADFEEADSYVFEDLTIPIRLELQKYPDALDKIVEADKKLVERYEKLPKGYFKDILTPIYKLALKNLKKHNIEAA
ncbi:MULTISPECIES: hypothetical protein [unclassified Nitratiruptor]|uniref:hypothetical protein n=1 Tax=unclassified Nitratiruptor TaxID=2624044 RepID=UPI00191546CE|nr:MULTISPECIES: hypothetical protein [unclassified Nitratiruptor]BCD59622.1 hypothetical protein NitYY0810_C0373 [Nitratiruptor sp. YY08-10]BCD63546.1 hypothetical protein NitYY0814_C0373 [Nitratiruptor sp. YY08-14]BCD83098.1 hypothetical protein NrS2_48 [Nitratiruptor phage NrS-2]BCD83164.1 hypothetical protein NrS3_48 [Nitratiruptor phage NrS-3]